MQEIISLGISEFNEEENYSYSSGEGLVDVDMIISFDEDVEISPLASYFNRFLFITLRTTGDVDSIGIYYLYYESFINGNFRDYEEEIWTTPINPQINDLRIYPLNKYDNYTIMGYADVQFNDGLIIHNETVTFTFTYIVSINGNDLFEIEIATVWIEIIDIVAIIFMIRALYRTIRGPVKYKYDEEMQRKDREYFEYLKKKKETESNQ